MAVLVECISVIVRCDSILSKYSGGHRRFLAGIPNRTYCSDGEIARVGFMSPVDCGAYLRGLEAAGLRYLQDGRCQDIAVIDQQTGMVEPADWLQLTRFPYKGGHVVACWLCDGGLSTLAMLGAGVVLPGKDFTLATPAGWSFENSFSGQPAILVPVEEEKTRLRFLRVEGNFDVYLDQATGQESHIARTRR